VRILYLFYLKQLSVLVRHECKKYKNRKILKDAMMVTIAGISAAMKNTG